MKIVVNKCFGGFGISKAAFARLCELGCNAALEESPENVKAGYFCNYMQRNDPMLVRVVEELGDKANGSYANLCVVEVPDNIQWEISDYDGMESVEEKHRSWG